MKYPKLLILVFTLVFIDAQTYGIDKNYNPYNEEFFNIDPKHKQEWKNYKEEVWLDLSEPYKDLTPQQKKFLATKNCTDENDIYRIATDRENFDIILKDSQYKNDFENFLGQVQIPLLKAPLRSVFYKIQNPYFYFNLFSVNTSSNAECYIHLPTQQLSLPEKLVSDGFIIQKYYNGKKSLDQELKDFLNTKLHFLSYMRRNIEYERTFSSLYKKYESDHLDYIRRVAKQEILDYIVYRNAVLQEIFYPTKAFYKSEIADQYDACYRFMFKKSKTKEYFSKYRNGSFPETQVLLKTTQPDCISYTVESGEANEYYRYDTYMVMVKNDILSILYFKIYPENDSQPIFYNKSLKTTHY